MVGGESGRRGGCIEGRVVVWEGSSRGGWYEGRIIGGFKGGVAVHYPPLSEIRGGCTPPWIFTNHFSFKV